MYAVIVGCGRIGFNLAKALIAVGHEVTVIEDDQYRSQKITDELGSMVIQGDGSSITTLKVAGVSRADLVIAVTQSDEVNLAVCQMSKAVFNAPKTMALVKNPAHAALFRLLGIDSVINSTHLIISNIEEEAPNRPLVHLLNLQRHNMDIVALSIPPDAAVVGQPLSQIDLPPNSFITLVVKDEGPFLPEENLVIKAGDDLIVVTITNEEQALYEILTGVE